MHLRSFLLPLFIAAALGLGACGDTDPGGPSGPDAVQSDGGGRGTFEREGNLVKFRAEEPSVAQMVRACAPDRILSVAPDNGEYHPDVVYVVCDSSNAQ